MELGGRERGSDTLSGECAQSVVFRVTVQGDISNKKLDV